MLRVRPRTVPSKDLLSLSESFDYATLREFLWELKDIERTTQEENTKIVLTTLIARIVDPESY